MTEGKELPNIEKNQNPWRKRNLQFWGEILEADISNNVKMKEKI